MSESEMGLDNKGGHMTLGDPGIKPIDTGMPTGDSPGDGSVVGAFAGDHTVGGPADSAGVR